MTAKRKKAIIAYTWAILAGSLFGVLVDWASAATGWDSVALWLLALTYAGCLLVAIWFYWFYFEV